MNVHDGEMSTSSREEKRSWLKEVLLQPGRQREDNKTSAAQMPDTVTLRANRPCLDLWHLFTLILTQARPLAMMKLVFIVRARTKGVPREVLVAKMSQIPRKLEASLMTGSLYSLPLQSRKMQAVMPVETLQKRTSSLQLLLWKLPWSQDSMKRLFVVTERSSLTIMALSDMNQEESISDSASSTKKLYASKQPCGFERMRWGKVLPTWSLETFASRWTMSFCHRVIFR